VPCTCFSKILNSVILQFVITALNSSIKMCKFRLALPTRKLWNPAKGQTSGLPDPLPSSTSWFGLHAPNLSTNVNDKINESSMAAIWNHKTQEHQGTTGRNYWNKAGVHVAWWWDAQRSQTIISEGGGSRTRDPQLKGYRQCKKTWTSLYDMP
jgi:hypothetical protein